MKFDEWMVVLVFGISVALLIWGVSPLLRRWWRGFDE